LTDIGVQDCSILKKSFRLWLLSAAVVCAGGCKHFEARPLTGDRAAAAFQSRSLNDPGLRDFMATNVPTLASNWPPSSWDFPLLTLAALYYHPDMEVARAKLEAADAAVITAGARPNPSVAFSPSYSGQPLEFFSPWTLGFTLDVPIETAGKRGYRIAQARHLANSAALNVASTAWQIRTAVRSSLVDLYAANLTQEVLMKQQDAQNQIVGLLEARLKAGQSSLPELQSVRTAAAQTALQLRESEKQRAQARVHLAEALGLPVNALDGITLTFAAFADLPDTESAGSLRREALQNRPDLLGALAEYEASQSALQLEIARQYPDIHVGPGYAWNQGVNNYSLDFSLMLPVLNQNQGPIAEAGAQRHEAAARFTALQARVINEVDAALAGYRDTRLKLAAADTPLAGAQQRMGSVQASFDGGAADRLELLQTKSELHASELARTAVLVESQQALGLLEDAMQRSSEAVGESTPPPPSIHTKSK